MVYLHSVPVMMAVISTDIILEPRNIVIYYSPLIKGVISHLSLSTPSLLHLHLLLILCLMSLTSSVSPLIQYALYCTLFH